MWACSGRDRGNSSQPLSPQHETKEGSIVGTPAYLAPEVIRGEQATNASDVHALGIILYELATGRFPFNAQTAMQMVLAHATQAPLRVARSS